MVKKIAKVAKPKIKKDEQVWIYIQDSQMPVVGKIVQKISEKDLIVQVWCAMEEKMSSPGPARIDNEGKIWLTGTSPPDPKLMDQLYPRWHCKFCDRWNYNQRIVCLKCARPKNECCDYEASSCVGTHIT